MLKLIAKCFVVCLIYINLVIIYGIFIGIKIMPFKLEGLLILIPISLIISFVPLCLLSNDDKDDENYSVNKNQNKESCL